MTALELKAVLANACIKVMRSKQADDETKMIAAKTAIELHQNCPVSNRKDNKLLH